MMTDLTKIEKPFGLLTDDEQEALREWPHGVEIFMEKGWFDRRPAVFSPSYTYRAKPAPLTKPSINWDHVASKFKYLARGSDGLGYLHINKPFIYERYWSDGYDAEAHAFASYEPGTCDWRDSLVVRPGYEEGEG